MSGNLSLGSNVVPFPARRDEVEIHLAAPIVLVMSLALFLIYGAHSLIEASTELAMLDRHYRVAYLNAATQGVGR